MNVTVTPPHRRSRRLLAASAALGLTLGLSACTIGGSDDDDTVAATPQSSVTGTADQGPSRTGDAAAAADAPTVGVDELILTAADAPDLGLQPVPAEEISGGLDVIGSLTEGVRVEPEICADVSQDSLTAQAEPGTMAIQAGQRGETAFAVAVTTIDEGLADRVGQIERCPVMTVTLPIEGQEMVTESTNTLMDLDAPEGVEGFAAVRQDSSMTMMGQPFTSGNLMLTGTVRGIGISVTATNPAGQVTPEAQSIAMDAFAAQAAKVRDAA